MADVAEAKETIRRLREELQRIPREVQGISAAFERLRRWKERAVHELRTSISHEEGDRLQKKKMMSFSMGDPEGNLEREADLYDAHLETLLHELERHPEFILNKTAEQREPTSTEPVNSLEHMLSKFHTVAKQMRIRHEDRSTLEVRDEYDVQDMLHSLLKIDFDDIRPEEWTPSYAGGSSRMDFLLKEEKVVIEVKKTRSTLKDKEIGSQLLVDVQRYRGHPDCKTLICFVYDPEGLIGNPRGLINDLQKQSTAQLKVVAIINPM